MPHRWQQESRSSAEMWAFTFPLDAIQIRSDMASTAPNAYNNSANNNTHTNTHPAEIIRCRSHIYTLTPKANTHTLIHIHPHPHPHPPTHSPNMNDTSLGRRSYGWWDSSPLGTTQVKNLPTHPHHPTPAHPPSRTRTTPGRESRGWWDSSPPPNL
jgi:hypothetical protein